jgi:hypothetical protein
LKIKGRKEEEWLHFGQGGGHGKKKLKKKIIIKIDGFWPLGHGGGRTTRKGQNPSNNFFFPSSAMGWSKNVTEIPLDQPRGGSTAPLLLLLNCIIIFI